MDNEKQSVASVQSNYMAAPSQAGNTVPHQVSIKIHDDDEDEIAMETRRKTRHRRNSVEEPYRAPKHVHGGDWKDMINITNARKRQPTVGRDSRVRTMSSLRGGTWIEHKLKKRVCCQFVPSQKYADRCGCGLPFDQHEEYVQQKSERAHVHHHHNHNHHHLYHEHSLTVKGIDEELTTDGGLTNESTIPRRTKKWTINRNTESLPTDCYGTIAFEGGSHQSKAHYVRCGFDTEPETLSFLFDKIWKLPPPKLVITIHGGLTNFDLQPKLARLFRKGILKAAKSTDAWIITSGLNNGVIRHVAAALQDLGSSRSRSRVLAIGIAPWGMLKKKQRFEGKDITVNYSTNQFNKSRFAELNDRHSYFIFSDNGTTGRYGAEIILRKRLETYLAKKAALQHGTNSVPVVCVVLEGGAFTVKVVHDYITSVPRIPVVVCDGSGRAADLLSFAHQNSTEDGKLSDSARNQLIFQLEKVFNYDKKNTFRIYKQLLDCIKQRSLLTVFRLGEAQRQDVDHAILKALLKGKNLTPPEQLRLALAWNRADIARSEIFTLGREWSMADLHNAMMDALCHDRTDFVQLLLENGVSMHRFLTYGRLEMLYNTEHGPNHTLKNLLGIGSKKHQLKLTEVGHAMENLMGNAYKSNYTKEDFKAKYFVFSNRKQLGYQHKNDNAKVRQRSENLKETNTLQLDLLKTARHSIISIFQGSKERNLDQEDERSLVEEESLDFTFKYPYSELLIWSVLTKRQDMAMLMWRHGEEAMAKALIACRLYSSLASDASTNYLELEICEELSKNSEEFRNLSIEVLQYCSSQNVDSTLQLLTYELANWGNETCLSLAALDQSRKFLAHPCCQLLLSDLWHGALHIRNSSNIKVLCCLLVPPSIFLLEFKSKEELKLQPHTAAEHHTDNWESDGTMSEGSEDFSDIGSTDTEEEEAGNSSGRARSGSEQPLSFHQLMMDKVLFRRDTVAPASGSPPTNMADVQTKTGRSRTISTSKVRRRGIRKETETILEEPEDPKNKVKRRSTQKHVVILPNENDGGAYTTEGKKYVDERQPKQKSLNWRRKLREFYTAPITTFWLWSVSYFVFLIGLTYALLVETRRMPSWVEWYLFLYVVVWSIEVFRKMLLIVMVDTKKPIFRKLSIFFFNYRNGILAVALSVHVIGFLIRLNPGTHALGRVILASNWVLWCLKLVDYLSVHRQLGPYVTMASEMIPRMLPILCMLSVALLAFGVIRQSITFPYEDWHWLLIRNIFYKPYFMLYGEVYAPEIDTCGDEVWDTHVENGVPINQLNVTGDTCVPGYFVVPIFMTIFMIIANVLLMNTMVACCTYIFERNVEITQEIWLFERYRQVMEYESTPAIPPPFTLIYHIFWVAKWILVREHFTDRRHLLDASLKLFLSEEEVERIHSFEEESVEDMERERDMRKQSSNEERILRTSERTDIILRRVNNITGAEEKLQGDIREMEMKMQIMEYRHKEEMEYLRLMNAKVEQLLQLQMGKIPQDVLTLPAEPKKLPPFVANQRLVGSAMSAVPEITFDLVDSPEEKPKKDASKFDFTTDSELEGDAEERTPGRTYERGISVSSMDDILEAYDEPKEPEAPVSPTFYIDVPSDDSEPNQKFGNK
ncbi:unnamed protein product [Auanema sp. JU1783]|nr:unnamed protein product [Auanema sp. JU1783]